MFVYVTGETRMNVSERLRDELWSRYERANKEWAKKNYEEASAQLQLGLAELGHTSPRSVANLLLGILWQLFRIALGRLFSYFSPSRFSSPPSIQNRLAALFHYESHKFAYLNMRHEQDFVPKATSLNDRSDKRAYMPTYSYLIAVYHLLALYNQLDRVPVENARDRYEVAEFYLAIAVFVKLCMPSFLFTRLVRFIVKEKLVAKLDLRAQGL